MMNDSTATILAFVCGLGLILAYALRLAWLLWRERATTGPPGTSIDEPALPRFSQPTPSATDSITTEVKPRGKIKAS